MKTLAWAGSWTTGLLLVAAATGCGGLDKPYPEKQLFAIDVGIPLAEHAPADGAVLLVRQLRIAKPYDGQPFVYRVGSQSYQFDYYHGFVAEPEPLITGQLVRWLADSGLFGLVTDDAGAKHDLVLEGNVLELHGDYTDKAKPTAVFTAKFFLMEERPDATMLIHQKTYRQSVALKGDGPASLVVGWNEACRNVLSELSADLADLPPPTASWRPLAPEPRAQHGRAIQSEPSTDGER